MNTLFRYYRRALRILGATVFLFLLLLTLFYFFFGGTARESLLKRLVTGRTEQLPPRLCLSEDPPPCASPLPLELSALTD